MYTFLFDKKSLVLLLTGMTVAGGLLFSGGILVGVQWGLPLGSYTTPTPVVRKAAFSAERPCKPEPETAPSPVIPAAPVAPEPAAPEFEEPEPQVFAAAAPAPDPVPEKPAVETRIAEPELPEPAVLVTSEGRYSLQIGAFRQAKNSEKVIQTLQNKGYEPYVIEERGRSVLKTVRIGRFVNRGEALKAASDFRRREGMEAIVRPIG
jgi:cell division protein FtsN